MNVSPYIYCILLVYINVTNTVPKVTFLIDKDSDEKSRQTWENMIEYGPMKIFLSCLIYVSISDNFI